MQKLKNKLSFLGILALTLMISVGMLPSQRVSSQDFVLGPSISGSLPDAEHIEEEEDANKDGLILNFNNIDIIEFIRYISRISGMNFVFKEEELNFKITLISEEATNVDNLMAALLQVLRIHDMSLLQQDNNIIIHKNEGVTQIPSIVGSGELPPGGKSGLVTRVFQLRNAQVTKVKDIIVPLLSKNAEVSDSIETRHLIVTDVAENVQRIAELLDALDSPNVAVDIGTYKVRRTTIPTLVPLAEKILKPLSGENPLELIPQVSSDTVFVVSTPHLIERAIAVLRALDVPVRAPEELPSDHIENANFLFYKLQYHKGDTLVEALKEIGNNLTKSGTVNKDLTNAIASSQWMQATNSIIVTGDNTSLQKVEKLLLDLDTPLKQVLIEMLVIDTTITNSLDFGVQWDSSKGTKSLETRSNDLNFGGDEQVLGLGGATGLNLGIIGRVINHRDGSFTSLSSLVKALNSDSNTNIVMNPKIITQDNTAAEIFVGSNVAIPQGTIEQFSAGATGTTKTTTFDFRDIGSSLKVTPILGQSNIVSLDIEQEFSESNPGAGTAGTTGGTISQDTKTKTRVLVPDRHFLVLSGMIKESKNNSRATVPCLGGIPGLGTLMGQRNNASTKRNLMIFIRPHIINSVDEADRITEESGLQLEDKTRNSDFEREVRKTLEQLQLKHNKA